MVMNVRITEEMLLLNLSHSIQMTEMQSAPASGWSVAQKRFLHAFIRQLEDIFFHAGCTRIKDTQNVRKYSSKRE